MEAPQRAADLEATRAKTEKDRSIAESNGRKVKGLPATLQKDEDADIDAIGSIKTMNETLAKVNSQIADGSLQLGPLANTVSSAMNAAGASDESSANFASFKADLEKFRNESLRLNKGTQTEGDAERALNEMFTNLRDPKIVQQRMREVSHYNDLIAQSRANIVNNRRASQGVQPLDVDKLLGRPANQQQQNPTQPQTQQPQQQAQAAQQQPTARQPVYTISTPEQFASLPSGAHFIDPQGNHRVKE